MEKLPKDEIKVRSKRNAVLSRQFSKLLQRSLNSNCNRAIPMVEFIEELIKIAKALNAAANSSGTAHRAKFASW